MESLNLNLDGLAPDELLEAAEALTVLAAYAKVKAIAMQNRLTGVIPKALAQEEECERLYNTLPTWAKW